MGDRIKIGVELSDQLLFESNRTCCICTVSNKPVQIHHIDKDSSNNSYENLIVLCLECHSEAHTTGGFGRTLSIGQLKKHKKEWINRIKLRKEQADNLASVFTVTGKQHNSNINDEDLEYKTSEESYLLKMYLEKLLLVHRGQLLIAQADWDNGRTFEVIQGCDKMIDFYEAVLVELSTFYPKGNFEEKHPKVFFREQVDLRTSFHIAIAEPYGSGSAGSIGRASISFRIMEELKLMVKDMAWQLIETSLSLDFEEFETWGQEWLRGNEKEN